MTEAPLIVVVLTPNKLGKASPYSAGIPLSKVTDLGLGLIQAYRSLPPELAFRCYGVSCCDEKRDTKTRPAIASFIAGIKSVSMDTFTT
jgi:hypothetical protein